MGSVLGDARLEALVGRLHAFRGGLEMSVKTG